jgi:hypothetical protein
LVLIIMQKYTQNVFQPSTSIQESPSWKANSRSSSQEISRLSCKVNTHCYIKNFASPPYPEADGLFLILILIYHLRLDLRIELLSLHFPTKILYLPLLSSHIFITLIIFSEEYIS